MNAEVIALRNRDVAAMLERAALLLALRQEDRYRVRAYKRATWIVASLPEKVEDLARENRLEALPGIGPSLAAKIKEIVETGRLSVLEKLESAALPEKTSGMIMSAPALAFARELLPVVESFDGVYSARITGALRRGQAMVPCLEFVLACDISRAREAIKSYKHFHRQRWQGYCCHATHTLGVELTFHLAEKRDFIQTLWLTTGSREHVNRVAAMAKSNRGTELLRLGLDKEIAAEEDIYALAGLPFIEPEIRENRGEITAAFRGELPRLIEACDYRGDLHVHTDWSDGTAGIEQMAGAAAELGYEYLAITDHSRSLKIAGGLSLERLAAQIQVIKDLQKACSIRIFTGIEVDILPDGSLDAPVEVLAGLDVVVASVHSAFRQSKEQMTARICRAMQNPYVQIIGHPTGRLLNKRKAYEVDMEELLKVAAATGTILEINATPDRLDIDDNTARKAKAAGILLAVNTDAHSQTELANAALGLSVARRAWLSREDVINTASARDVQALLQRKRTGGRR